MNEPGRRFVPLLLAAAAFGATLAAPSLPAHAGWWDQAGAARPISFEEARSLPENLGGLVVTFRAKVRPTEDDGVLARGLRRGAWPTVAVVPIEGEGEAVEMTVRPRTFAALRAAEVEPGTICILHAAVHVQRGRRTLELQRLTRPTDPPTPEEAARAKRADRFIDSGNPEPARDIYEALLAEREHDDTFRLRLLRRVGQACIDAREHDAAVAAYERLLEAFPDDDAAGLMLAGLRKRRVRATARVGSNPPRAPGGLEVPLPEAPSLAGPDGLPLLTPDEEETKKAPARDKAPPPPQPAVEPTTDGKVLPPPPPVSGPK